MSQKTARSSLPLSMASQKVRGLITLVNDNHVDNYLKKILAFVCYGSIVNSRPKNVTLRNMIIDEAEVEVDNHIAMGDIIAIALSGM